jgi:hypothetical protein
VKAAQAAQGLQPFSFSMKQGHMAFMQPKQLNQACVFGLGGPKYPFFKASMHTSCSQAA